MILSGLRLFDFIWVLLDIYMDIWCIYEGRNMGLNPIININDQMLNFIAEIDEFKGSWKLFGQLTPDRLQALKKVATIESIGSSTRIEGARLSDREVEKLLSRINTYSFHSRDEEEVAGYAYVCEEVFTSFKHIPFSENTIQQLHGWLLKYSSKDERHRGRYKKFPNHVEAFSPEGTNLGVVFETSTPFDTPMQMQELIYWTRNSLEVKEHHPLFVIAIFVVHFLAIHPFQDGNGRLSRVLTTLLLLQQEYLYVPYSSLESIIETNKESYYLALRSTQSTLKNKQADYLPWVTFFLRSLVNQKKMLETKVDKEKLLRLHMSETSAILIDLIKNHGKLTIAEMVSFTGFNRNTIKKNIYNN